jgi:NADH-quinone oxidoreductase subunit G/NADP-reducing hydrogenase subunit HndD
MVCPTGALVDISHIEKVQTSLDKTSTNMLALLSPAFVSSVSEYFGLKPSEEPLGLIVAALRKMDFDKVYDLSFGYDMNVMIEAELLRQKIENGGTLLSSCCPGWIKFSEEFFPQWIDDISVAKSPQQLMGWLLKNNEEYQVNNKTNRTVSFMPCVANKFEASREENTNKGESEIDAVITIREFLRMLRAYGLDLKSLKPEKPEPVFDENSKTGYMTAYSGGKAEAVCYALHRLTRKNKASTIKFTPPKNPASKKEVKVKINNTEVGFAWVSSINEAQKYLRDLHRSGRKDIHYVEVMACADGCVGGGGQPIERYKNKNRSRKKMCQDLEKSANFKFPDQNVNLNQYFQENFTEKRKGFYTQFHQREVIK